MLDVVVDAGDRHAAVADGLAQHAESAEVGDVEHDDEVGAPQLLDRLPVCDPRLAGHRTGS